VQHKAAMPNWAGGNTRCSVAIWEHLSDSLLRMVTLREGDTTINCEGEPIFTGDCEHELNRLLDLPGIAKQKMLEALIARTNAAASTDVIGEATATVEDYCDDLCTSSCIGSGLFTVWSYTPCQNFLEDKVAIQLQCDFPWGLAIIVGVLALLGAGVRSMCCRKKKDDVSYHHP
jgi:hypothetical protein